MNYSSIFKIFMFIVINTAITSLRVKKTRRITTFVNSSKQNHNCVISSRNNNVYCNSQAKLFIDENVFLKNKKLITISPGGYKGFYLLGILTYIKEKYETDNLIYSGASAGSWNSLFMCYKGNTLEFVYDLLDYNIKKTKSIPELEYFLKYKLLSNYKTEDFDLRRLFIGVTTIKRFAPLTNIFSDFETVEDAINCCIASSHIPLITGGLTNKYHNMFTFDGGFSNYPYLEKERLIHISPSMWEDINKHGNNPISNIKRGILSLKKYSEFFSVSKNNLLELFDDGYQDAKNNKQYLDTIFTPKNGANPMNSQQTNPNETKSNETKSNIIDIDNLSTIDELDNDLDGIVF